MILETKRLFLRPPVPSDVDAYLQICNSEFVLRYNAMTVRSREEVAVQFSKALDNMLLIERKNNGRIVGAVFLEDDSVRWDVASKEISYFLEEASSRKGYMKEALYAVIDYLFETDDLTCVAARSFAPNTASRRLLESLGFHQDGYIPQCVKGYGDVIFDDTLYSIFRNNWK